MIGQGYYSGYMPNVIKRNIFENQAGIHPILLIKLKFLRAFEALINFQTMVADLTNLDIANASLLDRQLLLLKP